MVGRQREINVIKDFLNLGAKGQAGALMICGPAGIGKTALARQACALYADSLFIETQLFEAPTLSYEPLIQTASALEAHYGAAVKKTTLVTPAADQDIVAKVKTLLKNTTSDKHVILLIEDIHWADEATLLSIPRLFEGSDSLRFNLVATCRTDGVAQQRRLLWLKNELRKNKKHKELTLPPLTLRECRSLIEEILGKSASEHLVGLIHDRTQGLPFFVRELTRSLIESGRLAGAEAGLDLPDHNSAPVPGSIRDMVSLQLEGLTKQARDQLEYAALIGIEFNLDTLNEICCDPKATDELLTYGIIAEKENGAAAFKHTLVRESVCESILWSKRKPMHRAVAEVFERKKAPAETVGDLWIKAGEMEKAREAFMKAAAAFCAIQAYDDALRTAKKALHIWPEDRDETRRVELLEKLSHCAMMGGKPQESTLALKEISESSLTKKSPQKQAEAFRSLAVAYALQGQWDFFKQSRLNAAEAFEQAELWQESFSEWLDLANRCIDELSLADALVFAEKAETAAMKTNDQEKLARIKSLKAYALSMLGRKEESIMLANEAIEIALAGQRVETIAYAYRKLAGAYEYSCDLNNAIAAYDYTLNFCRNEKLNLQEQFCLSCMSWALFRLGEWKRALEASASVIRNEEVNEASKSTALLVTGLIKLYRGEIKTAGKYLKASFDKAQKIDFRLIMLIVNWAMALYYQQEGAYQKAGEKYRQMIAYWKNSQDRHDIIPGLCEAASFFAGQRDDGGVKSCIDILSQLAGDSNNPEAIAALSWSMGEAKLMEKDYKAAEEHLLMARRRFDDLNIPFQKIQTEAKLGMLYERQGKLAGHLEMIREAFVAAKSMGARPLAAQLEALLDEAETPAGRSRRNAGIPQKANAGLTRRQFEIIQALAEGLSNKEIAARLHLSTRTVDMHVANILNRFNCRSRTEAVKLAMEANLIP